MFSVKFHYIEEQKKIPVSILFQWKEFFLKVSISNKRAHSCTSLFYKLRDTLSQFMNDQCHTCDSWSNAPTVDGTVSGTG